MEKGTNEQAVIYQVCSLNELQLNTKELLEQALEHILAGFQYPDIAEASIEVNGTTVQSSYFASSPISLEASVNTDSAAGKLTITVIYPPNKESDKRCAFRSEEQQMIDLVADILIEKIEKQASQQDLDNKEKVIRKAYNLAQIGHWELDLTKNELFWSKEIKRLHEVDEDYSPRLQSAINFYKEGEDRQTIKDAVQQAIDKGTSFDLELKIITAKGNERWIRAVGEATFKDGECQRLYGSTQNITTRKKAEEKLKNTEEKLRDIVENSTNMFYRHDAEHVLTYLSPQCEQFLGYSPEEAKQRWTEFVTDHPINKQGLKNTQRAIDTGQAQPPFELQLRKKNGKIIWVLVNEAPIVENGETISIVGSLTDITEQKRYKDQLEQLSLVASKTTDIIIMTDANEHITWVNDAFKETTGFTQDEVVGKNPGQLLQGPGTDAATVQRIKQKLQNDETVQEVILNYTKDGDKYWLDMTIDPILDEDGRCTGYIAIEKDVTQEIRRNQRLKESVKRYEIVSQATSDTIWELDLDTDTIQYNQNIYSMFGYQHDEVDELSSWWRDKLHPDDQELVYEKLNHALSSDKDRIQFEYRFKCADGSYKYIYDRAFVVRNSDNEPTRIIGAMQDITSFKEREQRSRKLQDVISDLATDRSLLRMDILEALDKVLQTSAQTLAVRRVNVWLFEEASLRCIYSYDDGATNTIRGKVISREDYPTYFKFIKDHRIIAAQQPHEHEALRELAESYLTPNNIQSVLNSSVISYGSTQAVVSHESVEQERSWKSDEISFAGAITDQIAQLLAHQEKKKRDQEIRDSLKEKETLLAEVHHRVKNNLAVVSGMMQLQAFEETDAELRNKLFDSVARIQTMASIHELLYKSNSFSNLRLDNNIKKLITNVTDTFQSESNITIDFKLDPVKLNVNQAIPCSLIVNEVVTNALKHAFDDEGNIQVVLTEDNKDIHLSITDNGKGLPSDFQTLIEEGSLGFKLIDTLSKQLQGAYQFESPSNGTAFSISFTRAQIRGTGNAHLQ